MWRIPVRCPEMSGSLVSILIPFSLSGVLCPVIASVANCRPSRAKQREPDEFHISSGGFYLLTCIAPHRGAKRPGPRNMLWNCSHGRAEDVQRPLIVCLRNELHDVCQATRQSHLQRVERAAAAEDTYTAPFRQLFVNEVWMCSTSSNTTWKHPVGAALWDCDATVTEVSQYCDSLFLLTPVIAAFFHVDQSGIPNFFGAQTYGVSLAAVGFLEQNCLNCGQCGDVVVV